jgi:hypothetical protein
VTTTVAILPGVPSGPVRVAIRVLPGAEDADEGGVHDADGESGDSGSVVGKVPGYVGKVP